MTGVFFTAGCGAYGKRRQSFIRQGHKKKMNSHCPGKIRAIVFDFDGTLAELNIDFDEMKCRLALLAQEHRLPPHPFSSLPALEWVERIVRDARDDHPSASRKFQEKAESLIRDMELEAAHQSRLFPFTRPLLARLKERSVKTAIITRNCEQAVKAVFPDLKDYCDCLLAREHVPTVKPHPDHLLRALRHLSVAPESALMVGDHPMDIETGKRAEVLTAGVWSGRMSQASLLQSGARWTAPDCESLISALTVQAFIC